MYIEPINKRYYFEEEVRSGKSKKGGVYLLTIGIEVYVGSSNNLRSRWTTWILDLANDEKKLGLKIRNAFAKYIDKCCINKEEFKDQVFKEVKFTILEESDINLIELEQKWIEIINPSLNIRSAKRKEYSYQKIDPKIKKANLKMGAKKRAKKFKEKRVKEVYTPIVKSLNQVDSKKYTEGKWEIRYKDKVWKFKTLSKFCRDNNLPLKLMNEIKEGRFKAKCPFSIKNTKPNKKLS